MIETALMQNNSLYLLELMKEIPLKKFTGQLKGDAIKC